MPLDDLKSFYERRDDKGIFNEDFARMKENWPDLITEKDVIIFLQIYIIYFQQKEEYNMIFNTSADDALRYIIKITDGKISMPERFFNRCMMKVVVAENSQISSNLRIVRYGDGFKILASNIIICENLTASEAIFHLILAYFTLNQKLPTLLKIKYPELFKKFFN